MGGGGGGGGGGEFPKKLIIIIIFFALYKQTLHFRIIATLENTNLMNLFSIILSKYLFRTCLLLRLSELT